MAGAGAPLGASGPVLVTPTLPACPGLPGCLCPSGEPATPSVFVLVFAMGTLHPIVQITDNIKQGWVQSLGPLLLGDRGQLLYKLLW